MKTTSIMTLTAVLGLLFISGCIKNIVDIHPAQSLADESKNVVKGGNVHVLPMKKESLILEVEPGVTNLDPGWAYLKVKSENVSDTDAIKPSEFVTTVDITKMMQERTIEALQQAGFKVTEGEGIPVGADLIIAPSLQAAFVSSDLASPSAILRVMANFKNAKTGSNMTILIVGRGQSYLHFTLAQGLERAMNEAVENYQTHLIQDTRDFRGSL
jgi:hypothetical protein